MTQSRVAVRSAEHQLGGQLQEEAGLSLGGVVRVTGSGLPVADSPVLLVGPDPFPIDLADPAYLRSLAHVLFTGPKHRRRSTGRHRRGERLTGVVLEHVPERLYRLATAPEGMPPGYYVKSARSGGQDVLRDGLVVGGGEILPLQIVVASGTVRLEGIARNSEGKLVPEGRIVMVPPLGSRRTAGGFPTVVAGTGGASSLDTVPPGDYRVLALDLVGRRREFPNGFWEAPGFLRQYEPWADRIRLDPGATMSMDVEVTMVP
jgi:hypothetical protein